MSDLDALRGLGGELRGTALPHAAWELIAEGRAPAPDVLGRVAHRAAGVLGSTRVEELRSRMSADLLGLGPLEDLVGEAGVTDVLVNGDGAVWIDSGSGLQRRDLELPSGTVRDLAVRLAGIAGRRLDDASPCVDGLLPGGLRLHAILPPLCAGGAHISLRVPRDVAWSLDELASRGMWPVRFTPVLEAIVARRLAFVVSGGTGSGKTTLLAALLDTVPADERILVVEDARELRLSHPHVVSLEARPANVEGRGEVPLRTLVRQALRMRPDRLALGEVRGAEVRELLAALNTGHEGGCGTLHANAAEDVVARFEALGALAEMGPQATRTQLASAVDVVLHVSRRDGIRQLETVGCLERGGEGQVWVTRAVHRERGRFAVGPAWPALAERLGLDATDPGWGS